MGSLENKVAVITGSTRGLGLAIAQAYAREGASVVAASRSAESVQKVVDSLQSQGARASGIACDVGELSQVEALAAHALDAFGQFDIWVNNAGISAPYGPTIHVQPEAFVRTVQTNVLGTYHGSIVAMQHFLPKGAGKLINILGRGSREPSPMQNAYAASKAWIRNFTLTLAREYKNSGVGIFAFNPGMMRTELLTRVEVVAGYEASLNPLATIIRMWATPPQAPARKAVWLASAATDGRTGLEVREMTAIRLSGGLLAEGLRRLAGKKPDETRPTLIPVPPAIPPLRREKP